MKAYNEGVHSYWRKNDDLRQWSVRLGMLTQDQADRIQAGKKLTDVELITIQRKVLNGELKNPADLQSNTHDEITDTEGSATPKMFFDEGAVNTINTSHYERSREAREQCITLKGCRCTVCGMDFKVKYGDIGEGFIHIHHITPISTQGKEYTLDVATDLVPVCPNCHAMLHRKNPPFTIDEMKEILNHQIH